MGKMTTLSGHGRHSALSRRVISAMGLFGSVEGVKMLCMLVRNKLAAYLIGTAGFGLLGILTNTINLLSVLCEMGLLTVGVREIASSPESERPKAVSFILRYGRWLAFCGFSLTLAIAPILSYSIFGSMAYTLTFMFLGVAVGCNTLSSSRRAVLQGEGHLKSIARAAVWSTVIGLAFAVTLLWWLGEDGVMPMLVAYSVVMFLSFLFFSRRGEQLPAVSRQEMKEKVGGVVRLGFFLTLSGVSSWLSSLVLMGWINHEGTASAVGLYQVGDTLTVKYVGVVFTALSIEFFPRISSVLVSGKMRATAMLRHETVLSVIVVTILCSVLIPLAPIVVRVLYSGDFIAVVPMVVWATPGIVLRAVSWSMAYVILAAGRGRVFLVTETVSAVLCVLIMGAGFKFYGMTGLGVGFTLWYLSYALMIWTVLRGKFHIVLGARVWGVCCVASAGVLLIAFSSQIFSLTITAVLAATVFIAASAALLRQLR